MSSMRSRLSGAKSLVSLLKGWRPLIPLTDGYSVDVIVVPLADVSSVIRGCGAEKPVLDPPAVHSHNSIVIRGSVRT